MQVNGEAIYATQASPFRRPAWGRCTRKQEDDKTILYLHVFDWPEDGKLLVPVSNSALGCCLLADSSRTFEVTRADRGLVVQLTGEAPDPICSVVVLEVEGEAEALIQYVEQAEDGSLILQVSEALINNPGHRQAQYESGEGKNNIGHWTDAQSFVEWPIKVTGAGEFAVSLELATPAEGVKLQVEVGDSSLTLDVPQTGNYDSYVAVDAGVLQLAEGAAQLAVCPVAQGWQPVNLRSVSLKPL